MLPRNRMTLVTLGVADLPRAQAFYSGWGWIPHPGAPEGLALFQMNGTALALFALDALAADQDRPVSALGTGAATFAQNGADEDEARAIYDAAIAAGATPLRPPRRADWGGLSGYVADPDGHVWEIAHNPFWPLDASGNLALP